MEASDYIAIAALVLAGLSAFYAWRATVHTRTQANAAIGNIPPDVQMKIPHKGGEFGRTMHIIVRNHNREPVQVLGFKFVAPDEISILHRPNSSVDQLAVPTRVTNLPYPVTIDPGTVNPTQFNFTVIANNKRPVPETFEVRCAVRFRVGNSMKETVRECFQTVGR